MRYKFNKNTIKKTFIYFFAVFSDGQINDERAVMELVRLNSHHTRVFSIGVGKETCRHVIYSLSR